MQVMKWPSNYDYASIETMWRIRIGLGFRHVTEYVVNLVVVRFQRCSLLR